MKSFYITTTLPYVNSSPHVGFAMEIVRADVVARFKRIQGYEVFFNTGTDEHGTKIYQKSEEEGREIQDFVDEKSKTFENLNQALNISEHHFIRTTDKNHKKAAQDFWKICHDNGYIYKKNYRGLYCVGCEMFKKEKDLIDGKCAEHPNQTLSEVEEENYFFAYSKFKDKLLDLYKEKENFVIPESRLNEIKNFVENDLEDFSVSRLKEKMPWGVEVPDDNEHVMYVWFDALVNYISTLGWPEDEKNFEKFWKNGTPVQYCGKDNLQHQSARWQAMLMSVGLPTSSHIVINGFITSDGQKMSKSLGNVIDPIEIISEYNADALRYYLLRELSPFEDGDFTLEKFKVAYNANLANGLGNVVSRVLKMSEDNKIEIDQEGEFQFSEEYLALMEQFKLNAVMDLIWQEIGEVDSLIQEKEPFKLIKSEESREEARVIIKGLVTKIWQIAKMLEPFLPETSSKILEAVQKNQKPTPIFERKD